MTFAALLISALFVIAVVLRARQMPSAALAATLAALFASAITLESRVSTVQGLYLGLGPITALFFWLLALLHLGLRKPLELAHLDYPVLLGASTAIPIGLLIHDIAASPSVLSLALRAHIVLSLVAWAVLTLAAWQAIACAMQSHRLRNHRKPLFPAPLMQMENSSFRLITIGWVILIGGIATGFLFVENFVSQHLAHKATLTILAAVLFGVLLIGRALRGWRGDQALRWILTAWILLFVGYAGVKLILEEILQRSWV